MHFRVSLSSAALFVALLTLLAIPSFALPISGDLHIAGLGDAQVASTFLNFLCQTIGNPTSPCPAGYGNFQATSGTQSFAPYAGDVGFIHSLNNAGVGIPRRSSQSGRFVTIQPAEHADGIDSIVFGVRNRAPDFDQ